MAGFRTFATGEVLTAANVNNFLMGQSVMRFADADARTAALGADVVEGMLTYNLDTDQLEVFDGTNFVIAAPEPPAPPAGIGSNVVSDIRITPFTTTSTTFVDVSDLDVTITPSSATSKILVVANVKLSSSATANQTVFARLVRDSTAIAVTLGGATMAQEFFQQPRDADTYGVVFVDSPATASPVVYKIQLRTDITGTAFINQNGLGQGPGVSTITAIEVAA